MGLDIVPYGPEHVEAVKALNVRLRAGGITLFQFPESNVSAHLPRIENRQTYEEYFLARENRWIRGGYILKHQPFLIHGRRQSIAYLQLPLSEGIVNKTFAPVGLYVFADAFRRQPLLFGLGMGSLDSRFVQIMLARGAQARAVPFYFRVTRPSRFFREIAYLRTTDVRRRLLDALAISGVGGATIRLAQAAKRRGLWRVRDLEVDLVDQFGNWCDDLWERCKSEYAMVGFRDGATLGILYPGRDRFIRLRVSRRGVPIGWAVILATQMRRSKHFGNMRVGTVVDCLAVSSDAESTIAAATRYLEQAGVDVIVSNQSASAWRRAFRRNGYLSGPSNFIFAPSKELVRLLGSVDTTFDRIHLTRGDGEGPSTL